MTGVLKFLILSLNLCSVMKSDGTVEHTWREASAVLQSLLPGPSGKVVHCLLCHLLVLQPPLASLSLPSRSQGILLLSVPEQKMVMGVRRVRVGMRPVAS